MPLFQTMPLWREVFWASYVSWGLMEFWIFSRDLRVASGKKQDRGSVYFVVAMVWIAITIAFVAPYMLRWAAIVLPAAPVFWMAIALIWGGMAIRLWAVLTLGKFFRTSVRILDEHRLVTAGPYRFLRHPAYTGTLITGLGIGLAMGNWVSVAGAMLCLFAGYGTRILVEEKALRTRFGAEFEAHKQRTWAVIPLLW